mmetsp:Transcript_56755/g.93902  ORF Transcript_56755/g.93902 Transcript_56755/m.93902 type:complete len:128 (+) Transcript_56755:229-612(+)
MLTPISSTVANEILFLLCGLVRHLAGRHLSIKLIIGATCERPSSVEAFPSQFIPTRRFEQSAPHQTARPLGSGFAVAVLLVPTVWQCQGQRQNVRTELEPLMISSTCGSVLLLSNERQRCATGVAPW